MKYESAYKVYVCCGQYIAQTTATKSYKVICPRCGKQLKTPVAVPHILITSK